MFIVSSNPTFAHDVKVKVPVDGGYDEQTFRVRFRVLPTDGPEHDLSTGEGSTKFLCAIVENMDDLGDADGKPIPYNDGVRDQVFRFSYVRSALVRAYYAAIGKAIEGN